MGVALAGLATVGGALAPVTVTAAELLLPPALAVTVAVPLLAGAVYSPVLLSVPTPLKLHVNVGCVVRALAN